MLFTTPTQFAVLLLLLVIGWLFGFASHPGGKKWKQSYRDEQSARSQDVAERDERIRALEVRNTELVADLDKARRTGGAAAPVAATAAGASVAATDDATPGRKRGWFEWGRGDDLTRLRGVDADLSRRLTAEGIDSYAGLAALSDQDAAGLERQVDLPTGFIERERLREQAKLLAAGQADEHGRTFG